jgi:hypothetical protein
MLTTDSIGLPATPAHAMMAIIGTDQDPVTVPQGIGTMTARLNTAMGGLEEHQERTAPTQHFRRIVTAFVTHCRGIHLGVLAPCWMHQAGHEGVAFRATFVEEAEAVAGAGVMTVATEAEIATLISETDVTRHTVTNVVENAKGIGVTGTATVFEADDRRLVAGLLPAETFATSEMHL